MLCAVCMNACPDWFALVGGERVCKRCCVCLQRAYDSPAFGCTIVLAPGVVCRGVSVWVMPGVIALCKRCLTRGDCEAIQRRRIVLDTHHATRHIRVTDTA